MTDLQMWSLLVGLVLPAAVSAINRVPWPGWLKGLTAIVTSMIAGGVTAWLNGQLSGRGVLSAFLVVALGALAMYRLFWKPTGLADKIEQAINSGLTPPGWPSGWAPLGLSTDRPPPALRAPPPAAGPTPPPGTGS